MQHRRCEYYSRVGAVEVGLASVNDTMLQYTLICPQLLHLML